jgi:hypothetical protein
MRMARSTRALIGASILALGLWGALIHFLGPYVHYSFARNTVWHFMSDRLWLDVPAGAVAVLTGGVMIPAARRPTGIRAGARNGRTRRRLPFGRCARRRDRATRHVGG